MRQRAKWAVGVAVAAALILGSVLLACAMLFDRLQKDFDFRGDARWKAEFLRNQHPATPSPYEFGAHFVHPTRGWTPKPNVAGEGLPRISVNDQGQRSTASYIFQPDKYRILVLGDSFTFGIGADDAEIWPTILQGFEPRCYVINLGVCGYGVDQMYITLRETIEEYKPHLVVFAVITDDLCRSLLSFREYKKPRFIIGADDNLVLTNTPIGSIAEELALLKRECGGLTGKWKLIREDRELRKRIADGSYNVECELLNARIIREAIARTREAGCGFLLVHLASDREIDTTLPWPEQPNDAERVLSRVAEGASTPFLATRQAFLASGRQWTQGHYQGPEAQFAARLIHDKIRQLQSWKTFCKE